MDRDDFAAMTINERLHAAGLLHTFDAAARKRDRQELIRLLRAVAVNEQQAEQTVAALLADPAAFGY